MTGWGMTFWKDAFSFFTNDAASRIFVFALSHFGFHTVFFWGGILVFLTTQRNMLHILALQSAVLLFGGKHNFSLFAYASSSPLVRPRKCVFLAKKLNGNCSQHTGGLQAGLWQVKGTNPTWETGGRRAGTSCESLLCEGVSLLWCISEYSVILHGI